MSNYKLDFYLSERPPEKVASELTDDQREAELMKKKGNEQFVEKNLNLALDFYQKAVELGGQTNKLTVTKNGVRLPDDHLVRIPHGTV